MKILFFLFIFLFANCSLPTTTPTTTTTTTTTTIVAPPSDYHSAYIGTLKGIPGGIFQRDSTQSNCSTVAAFHISEKEITRSQFTAITGLPDPSRTIYSTGYNDPVQQTNWYHALVFCNRLSIGEGLTPVYTVNGSTNPSSWGGVPITNSTIWNAATMDFSANGYRLPTEMEWMWAAMGAANGTTGYLKAFSGSNGTNAMGSFAWTASNSSNSTHPVGTKMANELGIYDMTGNVWEWCWDWYGTYPAGAIQDYTGVASGGGRVLRGGSWGTLGTTAPIDYRYNTSPYFRESSIGFRVVRP